MLLNPATKRLINLSTCCLTRSAPTTTTTSSFQNGNNYQQQPGKHNVHHLPTTSSLFCPIYSLDKSASSRRQRDQLSVNYHGVSNSLQQQRRLLANTSSGYFAPSTAMANWHRHYAKEPRAIFNVYEPSDHLPSLPVPELDATLERLKETIWPIAMNSVEFANTLHLIEKFSKSAGPKLDLLLREKAKHTKNWVTHDWWIRETYMKARLPLVINSNPSMIYPNFPFEVASQRSVLQTIAQLISGLIDFKLALSHGFNPEATSAENQHHLDPFLCYDQYKNIFGSLRVPGEHCDSLELAAEAPNINNNDPKQTTSMSVVLSFRGKFFEIQLNDVENEQSRLETLTSVLKRLAVDVQGEAAAGADDSACNGVGVLTTTHRDQWAKAYKLLDRDSLDSIKKSQFVVCLDTIESSLAGSNNGGGADENHHSQSHPQQLDSFLRPLAQGAPLDSEQHLAALSRQILHCDRRNIGNRWFDKPIQLIVVASDQLDRLYGAGINHEHSLAEAVVVAKMIEFSYDKTVERQRERARLRTNESRNLFNSSEELVLSQRKSANEGEEGERNGGGGGGSVRQLKMFNDDHEASLLGELIKRAHIDYVSQIDQFDLACLAYKNYGSNSIKSWHFSPDSWFQVALQLAYYNLHKRPGPCYESASTRRFAYGRTETIRSLTKDVAEFCMQPNYDTLKSAIGSHKSYANAANNAAAIDRVLLGYRMIFQELKSNSWAWGGLPSFDGGQDNKTSTGSLESNNNDQQQQQSVSVNDLFSEKELETMSAFFNNELIERSKKFALSTSQVSSPHSNIFMSFGPLLADGYGCCYNITGQQIVASISANSSNQSFSCEVHRLNESLRESLDRMRDIVEEHLATKKSAN